MEAAVVKGLRTTLGRFAPAVAMGLVASVGIAGLVCDHLQVAQLPIANLHLLFGIGVCLLVGGSLLQRRWRQAPLAACERYLHARRLSRHVYLLIYALALIRVGMQLVEMHQWQPLHLVVGSTVEVRPLDDLQIYIAYALVPLWLLRALALSLPVQPMRVCDT